MWNPKKRYHHFIARDNVKNILSYVDFSGLFNVILSFPELSPDFLTNGITFPLSNSKRSREWRKEVIEGFNCYLRQINANKYNDYIITDTVFVITLLLKDEVILNLPVKRYFKHNN